LNKLISKKRRVYYLLVQHGFFKTEKDSLKAISQGRVKINNKTLGRDVVSNDPIDNGPDCYWIDKNVFVTITIEANHDGPPVLNNQYKKRISI